MKKRLLIDCALVLVCLAIGIQTALDQPVGRHWLELELSSSDTAVSELFYDLGDGFQGGLSVEAPIQAAGTPVAVRFPLPQEQQVKALRWDPISDGRALDIVVANARVVYYDGLAVHSLELAETVPMHQLTDFAMSDLALRFRVLEGDMDPHLGWFRIPPLPDAPSRGLQVVWGAFFGMLGGFFLILCYRLVNWYFDA